MLKKLYYSIVIEKPLIAILLVIGVLFLSSLFVKNFYLDASSDSLVLKNDKALEYYRSVIKKYGAEDFVIITYAPKSGSLFNLKELNRLKSLRDEIETNAEKLKSITTILDVPLIKSPKFNLGSEVTPKLLDNETNLKDAKKELIVSPLFKDVLISKKGDLTTLLVQFVVNSELISVGKEKDILLSMKGLNVKEKLELKILEQKYKDLKLEAQKVRDFNIGSIKKITKDYAVNADIFIGGLPMITSDSIAFIRSDLKSFGVAVLVFIIALLVVIFRKVQFVILPAIICSSVVVFMVGFLGFMNWPVSVISSNFVSLFLIITLSLNVHLTNAYFENAGLKNSKKDKIKNTIKNMIVPCFYNSLTTTVAFGSLIISGIKPVIDFGWMMVIGIIVSFITTFILYPAILALFPEVKLKKQSNKDFTLKVTGFCRDAIKNSPNRVFGIFGVLFVISIVGINNLTVENRFIDYFKSSTDIYKGMVEIDEKLGGTTPIDVIIDAPQEFLDEQEDNSMNVFGFASDEPDISSGYWFNSYILNKVSGIHGYLDDLKESGKVLSFNTAIEMIEIINKGKDVDGFFLSVFYKKAPEEIKNVFFKPYVSEDGNQLRFSVRFYESDKSLQRNKIITQIKRDLISKFDLDEDQVKVTGMMVLYNNMLQSLFKSQILTIGFVFSAIFLMFVILFRNLKLSLIALIPNILSAASILGIMGLAGIPLDIMTISIAAIVIGIGVDDTIHYVHRFRHEFEAKKDIWEAIKSTHSSIGKALYYTSITITFGFFILVFSNFVPTIYFGILTALSMMIALFANLTLLPLLIMVFKPVRK
jgi:predicted RND superfamily exporter protein